MGYGNKGVVGSWTKEKLNFLESYLPSYTTATKNAYKKYYVDGFAGLGNWTVKETKEKIKGSVRIALETYPPFTKYFFIEKNPDRAQKIIKIANNYTNKNSEILCGDCNEQIKKVFNQINKKSPTFVFLDPSGAHLKWSTIEYLSKWKTELFINFPLYMDLQRNLPNNQSKLNKTTIDRLNAVFGGNEWKEIYERKFIINGPQFSINSLMELYIEGLKDLGYTYVMYSDAIRNSKGIKLYYMIWVGKHNVGNKIMDHVLNKQFKKQLTLFNKQ